MLPLWKGGGQVCGPRTPVAAGYRAPAGRNGSELREMLPLWKGGMQVCGPRTPVAAGYRDPADRNGSE